MWSGGGIRTGGLFVPTAMTPAEVRNEKLTLAQVCAELRIERSTFYDWRAKGRAPKCSKLPNGELRIVRRDLDEWFEACRVP
jgi:predicted DNA-binding transcriptional regulator AlpA